EEVLVGVRRVELDDLHRVIPGNVTGDLPGEVGLARPRGTVDDHLAPGLEHTDELGEPGEVEVEGRRELGRDWTQARRDIGVRRRHRFGGRWYGLGLVSDERLKDFASLGEVDDRAGAPEE